MPMTAKSSPARLRTRSKGEASAFFVLALVAPTFWNIWPGPSKMRKMASGLRKMSRGPRKPAMERLTLRTANSVEMAADAPLESESCLPARMARKGMAWATVMPMADSICSAVAPSIAPKTAAEAMAPWTTWSTL